jgi:FlaA1/EpsC-like NDP-sugar epimerase
MTKALQEKIMTTGEVDAYDTKFIVVRYGNVIGSRGSVIPFFKDRLEKKEPLIVSDFRMTRFLLPLPDAIRLAFKALLEGKGNEIFVLKKPACLMKDLAEVMAEGRVEVHEGKIRPGEKIHEILVQEDEMRRVVEDDEHYIIYPDGTKGVPRIQTPLFEYSSENTCRLTQKELHILLAKEGYI